MDRCAHHTRGNRMEKDKLKIKSAGSKYTTTKVSKKETELLKLERNKVF